MAIGASTYDDTSTTDRNRCRRYMGDTRVGTDVALFSDAEWDDFLVTEVTINKAIALACETMANRAAEDFDFSADGSNFRRSARYEHWMKQASRWRRKSLPSVVVMPTPVDGFSQNTDADAVTATQQDETWPFLQ